MGPDGVDVFPIDKNGDIPASYVSLPEGTCRYKYTIHPLSSVRVGFGGRFLRVFCMEMILSDVS